MSSLLQATIFATKAHGSQLRKYTGTPYILHPLEVAGLVAEVTTDPNMISAAILHDTVEDTPATYEDIVKAFGYDVGNLVLDLTDVSQPSDGNRKIRKEIDLRHTAGASPRAKTIKLADLINNTQSIVEHDPGFAKTYMAEKRALLEVLTEGNAILYNRAMELVKNYFDE